MESIMYRDPELEASFSFNSAFHVFSDVDEDDEGSLNDDEYIEIALEQQPKNPFEEDELELRISFSSSSYNHNNIGLSRTSAVEEWEPATTTTTTTTPTSFCSSSTTSTLTCSSAETGWGVDDHQPSRRDHKSTVVKRRVRYFRAVSRLLRGFFSAPLTSSERDEGDGISYGSRQAEIQTKIVQLDLLRNRRSGAKNVITKATNGGMMMKFLIKCRSINIRAVLAPFMKPYRVIISSHQSNDVSSAGETKKTSKETITIRRNQSLPGTPFDKWLLQREKQNPEDYKSTNDYSSSSGNYSLPPPVQQGYAGDNCSVQAAIAHCKRSFGQTSDFHF